MPLSPIREITALTLNPIRHNLELEFDDHAELNTDLDLNFPGAETQHATHSLHTYVAAINPPLAATMIKHYVPEGETVLDPFCGGGGVMVEAVLSGRMAIGCDINPLAVLLSKVKTRHISAARSLKCYQALIAEAEAEVKNARVYDVPDIIRFWYLRESLEPLRAIQNAVLRIKEEDLRQLFQVSLSAAARDTMLTYRGEIRLRRLQGKDLERFRPNVFAAFKKRSLSAMANVDSLPRGDRATILNLDCRKLTEAQRCHTVITSPPYGDDKNGVGYFQFSRNMLYWIGVPLEDQKRQKENFLGSMANGLEGIPSTPTLSQILEIIGSKKAVHHKEAASFYADYYKALARIAAFTDERVIVIIGDRVLSRTKINNGHITTEFMQDIGWSLEHYYSRVLTKKRIANLGGDGGGISLEHIMVFRRV
jgi:DNA modification methylase